LRTTNIAASAGAHNMQRWPTANSLLEPPQKPHANVGGHDSDMDTATDWDEPDDENPDALRPFRFALAEAIEAAAKAHDEKAGSDDR